MTLVFLLMLLMLTINSIIETGVFGNKIVLVVRSQRLIVVLVARDGVVSCGIGSQRCCQWWR